MNTNATMNALWNATGKTIEIVIVMDGRSQKVQRVIESRRACYGRSLALTLSEPLPGMTSRIYHVSESNAWTVTV
jgi:hypothetical protein